MTAINARHDVNQALDYICKAYVGKLTLKLDMVESFEGYILDRAQQRFLDAYVRNAQTQCDWLKEAEKGVLDAAEKNSIRLEPIAPIDKNRGGDDLIDAYRAALPYVPGSLTDQAVYELDTATNRYIDNAAQALFMAIRDSLREGLETEDLRKALEFVLLAQCKQKTEATKSRYPDALVIKPKTIVESPLIWDDDSDYVNGPMKFDPELDHLVMRPNEVAQPYQEAFFAGMPGQALPIDSREAWDFYRDSIRRVCQNLALHG